MQITDLSAISEKGFSRGAESRQHTELPLGFAVVNRPRLAVFYLLKPSGVEVRDRRKINECTVTFFHCQCVPLL